MRAESARNPTIAKIAARADRGTRKLLSHLISEGQARGQVDPALDAESVAAVVHSIIFGLNRLGAIRDSTFNVKTAFRYVKVADRTLSQTPGTPCGQASPTS
jgi:hypothetical protein